MVSRNFWTNHYVWKFIHCVAIGIWVSKSFKYVMITFFNINCFPPLVALTLWSLVIPSKASFKKVETISQSLKIWLWAIEGCYQRWLFGPGCLVSNFAIVLRLIAVPLMETSQSLHYRELHWALLCCEQTGIFTIFLDRLFR